MRPIPHALAGLLLALALTPAAAAGTLALEVVEGQFVLRQDGVRQPPQAVIGLEVTVTDGASRFDLRIGDVVAADEDPSILLYAVETRQAGSPWANPCTPDAHGRSLMMPVSGTWDAAGTLASDAGFSLSCTSGTLAKCVLFGYPAWRHTVDGAPAADLHAACTRMLRADYCGNGHPWTRNGTLINMADRHAIRRLDPLEGFVTRAVWAADGALCVEHPRIAQNGSLVDIVARCPQRLAGRVGPGACAALGFDQAPQGLLLNQSRP